MVKALVPREPFSSAKRYRKMAVRRIRPRLMARAPTFTETFTLANPVLGNTGGVFQTRIDDIPQLAQYSNLYRQYKINWVKFTLIPDFNSYEGATQVALQGAAMPRIAWAVNTSPDVAAPINEPDLLQDNGAKFRTITSSWSASCKPTPNIATTDLTGGLIPTQMRARFLNFTAAGVPNPVHGGISYWVSQALAGGAHPTSFHVYVKLNFSLRDPQ